jgi:hypothetical protein
MATMFIHDRCYVRKLFVIIIIVSVLLTGVTPVGAIAADETTTPESSVETPLSSDATPQIEISNTTRTLNQSTVEPGGAVRVTVTTKLNSTGDPALYEQLDPGPSNISITATEPAAVVDAVTNSSDEVAVIWESTNSTVAEYVIDISENASTGSQINISGVVETQNETLPIANNTVSIEDTSNEDDRRTNITRTLNQSTAEPGDAVAVTVPIELNSTGDPALYEQIGASPSNISITATEPAAAVDPVTNDSDEVRVVWDPISSRAAEYIIKISENISAEPQITISGVVETQNGAIPIDNSTLAIENASADGGDSSNNAGGGGGAAPPEEPTVEFDLTDRADGGAVVAVETIPSGADVNVTLAEAVTGEGSALQSLSVSHRIPPDNYRIDVTEIRDSPPGTSPRVDSSSIIGYLDADVIGIDTVESATLEFRVSDEALPAAADVTDVSVYRYTDEWEILDTRHVRSDGEMQYFAATVDEFSPFAIGVPRGDITIQDATVDTNTILLNESISVQATVSNEGAIEDDVNLTLSDGGGTQAEQQVTVPAGETVTVSFETGFDATGTYELRVNDVSAGEVSVTEPSTDTETQPESDNTADESPGFGVLVTLISLILITIYTRRTEN